MPFTNKQLVAIQDLPTSATTLYTVPASTTTIVSSITLTNNTADNTTYRRATVHIVPSGGSATTANRLIKTFEIRPNDTVVLRPDLVMPAGSSISALADAAGCSIQISGIEIT